MTDTAVLRWKPPMIPVSTPTKNGDERSRRMRPLFGVSLCIFLGGCGFVAASDFPGAYISRHQAAEETLELLPDGTFTQQVIPKIQNIRPKYKSQVLEATGTWQSDADGSALIFKGM